MILVRRRIAALAAALVLPAAPAAAQTAPSGAPLRTLVYRFDYAAQTRNLEHTSGLFGSGGAITNGSANVERTSDVGDDGTLTVNVVAATGDGGLVVDTTYDGKTTHQPTVRVAILMDGTLGVAPNAELSPEAARLLPLLARGFGGGAPLAAGAAWTATTPNGTSGATHYAVTALDGTHATVTLSGTLDVPGPRGYTEQDQGTLTYDVHRLCPLTLRMNAQSRHQPSAEQEVTTNAIIAATLVSDTFANDR